MRQYKVTNTLDIPFYMNWNLNLFSDEQLAEWEKYKLTIAYIGRSPDEVARRRRLHEAHKIQEWVNFRQIGEIEKRIDPETGEEEVIAFVNPRDGSVVRYDYKFKIDAGESVIVNARQKDCFEYLRRKPIEQKAKLGQTTPDIHYEGMFDIKEYLVTKQADNTETVVERPDTASLSFPALRALAKEKGIKIKPTMKRDDYIQALEESENG